MPDAVIQWLLEEDNPSVRYFTLTDLLDKAPDAPEVVASREAIMRQGPVPRILARQNEDGSWGVPEKFYTEKYTGTVWALLLLAELAASPADPRVRRACEFILQHSWSPESGGFSYMASARTGAGLASGVMPCLTGNMAYSLIRLGFFSDHRVQQAINWINTSQRTDDGDGEVPKGSMYERFEICWGRHSCHMGVAKAWKALAEIPQGQRSRETIAKLGEIAEYFLIHHLYKKSHNLVEVSKPGWTRLGFPLMYQTDILELLGLFGRLGIRDARMQDALQKIRDKRPADGRWILENSFNDRMVVRIEQKGTPSKWITLRALTALRLLGED